MAGLALRFRSVLCFARGSEAHLLDGCHDDGVEGIMAFPSDGFAN